MLRNRIEQRQRQLDCSDFRSGCVERALLAQKDYHRLFDAKLIRVRRNLGLPITQPTSLKEIPAEHEVAFREAYTSAAREVGQLFLDGGQLADAWGLFSYDSGD